MSSYSWSPQAMRSAIVEYLIVLIIVLVLIELIQKD